YALALIEHFWCAPYAEVLRAATGSLLLDLHNIESVLQRLSARGEKWPAALAFRRFAESYRTMESYWLPRFHRVLVASDDDARIVCGIAPHAHTLVYPNTIPLVAAPATPEADAIVFSGNLEYHPNLAAVRYFRGHIWPLVRERHPSVEWRVVGKNPRVVEALLRGDARIRLVGPVENAVEEIARAKVAVVPLLAGSGTRFKILEAWAAGRAVVSTSIGAEGLGAAAGEHLLVEDDPRAFAGAISALLDDPDLRHRLGAAGRGLFLENFTWEAGWKRLEEAGI
ncbi:MAG: glycosyltransferase, partial [Bryobacteraceae bacterium]